MVSIGAQLRMLSFSSRGETRKRKTFPTDLHELARWFQSFVCGITRWLPCCSSLPVNICWLVASGMSLLGSCEGIPSHSSFVVVYSLLPSCLLIVLLFTTRNRGIFRPMLLRLVVMNCLPAVATTSHFKVMGHHSH